MKKDNNKLEAVGNVSELSDLLYGRCRQCKAWGGQGIACLKHQNTGEYRYCAIDLYGDMDKETVPMFRFNFTYGSGVGVIDTHGDFGCPNFNSQFDTI